MASRPTRPTKASFSSRRGGTIPAASKRTGRCSVGVERNTWELLQKVPLSPSPQGMSKPAGSGPTGPWPAGARRRLGSNQEGRISPWVWGNAITAPWKPAVARCAGEATPRVKPMCRMDHSHQWPPEFTPVAASGPTVRWSAGEITCGKPKPERGTHLCLPERSQRLPAAEKAPDGGGEPGQNIAPVEGVEFTQHLGRFTLAVDGDGYRPRVGHHSHPNAVG